MSFDFISQKQMEFKMTKLIILLFSIIIFLSTKESYATTAHYMQGYFYSNLTQYGSWISLDYGVYAWRPTIITRVWSPYKYGRWIWTDYGWYWDSYEPFGYIVYHYGRWHYDDYYGWIWIPDYQWAPAWVEWRYDDFYIGWAPLPPYAVFRISRGIVYTHTYVIPVIHWHFVKYKYFGEPYVYNYYIPERTKYRVHSNTKLRNEYRYSNGRVRNEGIDFNIIRERGGSNIKKRELIITDNPRNIENTRSRKQENIIAFIADRDRIDRDRETTLSNVEVIRHERKTSLDLNRVELRENQYKIDKTRREKENLNVRESVNQNGQDRYENREKIDRRTIDSRTQTKTNDSRNDRSEEINQKINRNDNRELERIKEKERTLNEENRNRNYREQSSKNDNRINSNSYYERDSRNFESREKETYNYPKIENLQENNRRSNETHRNENRSDEIRRDRNQNSEQRQRSR
jgi:hypothetical protein